MLLFAWVGGRSTPTMSPTHFVISALLITALPCCPGLDGDNDSDSDAGESLRICNGNSVIIGGCAIDTLPDLPCEPCPVPACDVDGVDCNSEVILESQEQLDEFAGLDHQEPYFSIAIQGSDVVDFSLFSAAPISTHLLTISETAAAALELAGVEVGATLKMLDNPLLERVIFTGPQPLTNIELVNNPALLRLSIPGSCGATSIPNSVLINGCDRLCDVDFGTNASDDLCRELAVAELCPAQPTCLRQRSGCRV